MAIPRINGPIPVWKRGDTVPTDPEGGYAGGDGTAAAVGTSLAQSKAAWDTVDKLGATATSVDYGQPVQVTVSGSVPNKVFNFKIPKGMPEDVATALALDAATSVANSQAVLSDYEALVVRAENAETAAFAEPDAAMATVVGNPASDTRAAGDAQWTPRTEVTERDKQPVNAGNYEGTNDAATRAAVADAIAQDRPLHFPDQVFNVSGDLVYAPGVQADRLTITGSGDKGGLTFSDGGLILDADGMLLHRPTIENLNIRRTGASVGPALHLRASGEVGTGVARWHFSNVYSVSTQGTALLIEGDYIGDFIGCYFLSSPDGVRVIREAARGITGGNAINFIGGEIQGCQRGVTMTAAYGVSFLGTSIEGNTEYGVDLLGECNGTTFNGIYCEGNAGWDIRYNSSTTLAGSTGHSGGLSIHGGTFLDAGKNKPSSIELIRGAGIDIAGNYWSNQSYAPIRVRELTAGDVRGGQRNNHRWYPTPGNAGAVVDYGTSTMFDKIGSGRTYAISSDVNVVPAGGQVQIALSAPGVRVGDQCAVSTRSLLETGLIASAVVTAADTITLRVLNVTGASVDPAGRTWDFRVSQ